MDLILLRGLEKKILMIIFVGVHRMTAKHLNFGKASFINHHIIHIVMNKHFKRFFLTGLLVVGIDLGIYIILLELIDINIAKALSFVTATLISFFINKYWTFEKQGLRVAELLKFLFLYVSTLFINVFSNNFLLDITNIIIAFIIVSAISASINFLGQKYWVFR